MWFDEENQKRNRLGDDLVEEIMVARDCIRQRCFAFEKILSALQERLEESQNVAGKKIASGWWNLASRPVQEFLIECRACRTAR